MNIHNSWALSVSRFNQLHAFQSIWVDDRYTHFPFSLANKTSLLQIIFILEYLFFQYPSSGQHTVHLKHLNHRETWGHLQLPSESKFFSLFTSDFAGLVSSDFIKFSLRKKILTSALMMHNQAKSSVTFKLHSQKVVNVRKKSFPRKIINKQYPGYRILLCQPFWPR